MLLCVVKLLGVIVGWSACKLQLSLYGDCIVTAYAVNKVIVCRIAFQEHSSDE